jgi:hypothetical protein
VPSYRQATRWSRKRIISVGKDRHQFPRSEWGWLDHARQARLDQLAPGIAKPTKWEALPGLPVPTIPGGLYGDPEEQKRGRRRREIDAKLQDLGIRRKPWV